jgi:hypothetical protein
MSSRLFRNPLRLASAACCGLALTLTASQLIADPGEIEVPQVIAAHDGHLNPVTGEVAVDGGRVTAELVFEEVEGQPPRAWIRLRAEAGPSGVLPTEVRVTLSSLTQSPMSRVAAMPLEVEAHTIQLDGSGEQWVALSTVVPVTDLEIVDMTENPEAFMAASTTWFVSLADPSDPQPHLGW